MSSTPQRTERPLRDAFRHVWPAHKTRLKTSLLASLTLGLAPFYPHAHVWKQLVSLFEGTLTEPIDIFDLVLHGTPWVLLFLFSASFVATALRHHGRTALQQTETTSS